MGSERKKGKVSERERDRKKGSLPKYMARLHFTKS